MKWKIALVAAANMLMAANAYAAGATTSSNAEWPSYVKPLAPIGERLEGLLWDRKSAQSRQELYAHIYSVLAQGYFGIVHADPEHPAFWPFLNAAFNTLGPNPDDDYYLAAIGGEGIYRISGHRGTVRIVSFDFGSGSFFTSGDGAHGPIISTRQIDELQIRQDGTFEVLVSQKRPEGHTGDWWQLDPKVTYIIVRQRAYDILNEQDARLAIERLDRMDTRKRPNAAEIEAKLKQLPAWAEKNTRLGMRSMEVFRKKGLINKVFIHSYEGGLPTQHYIDGMFDLQPDEALILETEVPTKCLYWNFQLNDELYASLELMGVSRLAQLNGFTARLDKDGKFRTVISSQDPGVPNWLDTGGYRRGEILGRWQECSSVPLPTVTKVKVADVRRHLPADTPTVSTEARAETYRLRRKALQMRRKW